MLKDYIAVYVPSTRSGSIPLDTITTDKINKWTASKLSALFGGCTSIPSVGSWLDDNNNLITESITICKAYHDKDPLVAWNAGVHICKVIKRYLTQYAVTLESNQGIDFI